MIKKKVAFVGFRHDHIYGLWKRFAEDHDFEIAAACEEYAPDAEKAKAEGVNITHKSFDEMLNDTDFDILAIGDYYGIRGKRAIAGLEAGKHIITDKPLCVSLDELEIIRSLALKRNLQVSIMLDMRNYDHIMQAHNAIVSGKLGKVDSIFFRGCHALNYGMRPEWYFEPGHHGGTINDIAIHALDLVEFLTGAKISKFVGARTWNSRLPEVPYFHDAAQVLFALENGCGVIGDVSYFGVEKVKFPDPFAWRFIISGNKGTAEFSYSSEKCVLYLNGAETPVSEEEKLVSPSYYDIFKEEISGKKNEYGTMHFLSITEKCLRLQALADGAVW